MAIPKILATPLVTLLIVYLVICAAMWLFQRSMIYVPDVGARPPSAYGLQSVEKIGLDTPDGEKLEAWSWKGDPGKPVIAFFHGNAGNLSHRAITFRMFQALGLGFVALDYRGFGNSTGQSSEAALYRDAEQVLAYINEKFGVKDLKIVLYGESLGSGVVTEMATRRPFAGVVLQSPYTSVAAAAKRRFFWLPVDLLLTERFSNIDRIDRINAPLLVIHGRDDELFPVDMAETLVEKARSPKTGVYLANTGHNDLDIRDIADHLNPFVASLHEEQARR
jgi:pimeloyl-ACP methyl ester carboxylesterase